MAAVDALDEQILAELQAQGRLTMKALAEQVGLSSPAMIERVRRLEDKGVISGYRAVIQPAALGRPVTAMISARVRQADRAEFERRIEAEGSIAECHRITGESAYLMKAHLADMQALETLENALGEVGALCESSIVLSSPIAYRPVTPPNDSGSRARLNRRRRRAELVDVIDGEAGGSGKRRAGRPRGARRTPPPPRESATPE